LYPNTKKKTKKKKKKKKKKKELAFRPGKVTQAYNPTYLGGRD
jgi:hypothetical protein